MKVQTNFSYNALLIAKEPTPLQANTLSQGANFHTSEAASLTPKPRNSLPL